jgi:hypothetical protein
MFLTHVTHACILDLRVKALWWRRRKLPLFCSDEVQLRRIGPRFDSGQVHQERLGSGLL